MTQPLPGAPLTPLEPMQPMRPMQPLVPMQPLRPGERRGDRPAQAVQYTQTYVPYQQPVSSYDSVQELPPPSVQQQVVNLGLSQPTTSNWGGIPRPRVPARVRSGGSNKAGVFIGVVVAAIVGLAALGSRSSSGDSPDVSSVPSIAVSIPPLSIGNQHAPSTGTHKSSTGSHTGASKPTHQSSNAIDISGSSDGQRIRVTLLHLINNVTPKDTFMDSPDQGKRLVGAQFRVTNIGSFIYVASATSVAHLVDTKGHTYDASFLFDNLREGKAFNGAISVDTGHSAVGFIAFEIPKQAKVKKVEFSASSGSTQQATWTVVRS